MSVELYAVLIGIILLLIDIFFASDIPSFIGILLFCFAFYKLLPFHFLVNIIITILFFFAILVIYITLWKKAKSLLVDKFFAKDKYKAGVEGLAGIKGVVRIVKGEKFAEINGDLYSFYEDYPVLEKDVFVVKEVKEGKIVIEQS